MPEAATVEPPDASRGGRQVAAVALSGLAMLALLTAIGMWVVHRGSIPADTPSAAASTSPSAEPVPSTVPAEPWRVVRVGDPVTVSTDFTDPGTNDTHTCDIDWDDGTRNSGPAPDHVCQGRHAYPHAGMYTIRSVVTDDDGGVLRVPGVLVVVYDPAAGAVRGNGSLKPGQEGGFDFTARYPRRSATEPDGTVSFTLEPRLNLDLRNHQHLDWLVVTPDGKIAIKGTAERSPGQRIGFLLYGYHGCSAGQSDGCQPGPHRLRLVVWDHTANGPEGVPIRYDNRPGGSFDIDQADPQPIDQGVILT
jgi:hypothetical protein